MSKLIKSLAINNHVDNVCITTLSTICAYEYLNQNSMHKKQTKKLFLCLMLFFSSCTILDYNTEEKKPKWIFHFHIEGKICAVGTSLPHVDGFPYQQATAISRAIDQIAMQKSVHVKTSLEQFLYGTNHSLHSGLSVYSVQTTDGKIVRTIIKDTWQDPQTKMLYVWMFSEQ
ncbi:lipoprotein [Candidatus Magnetomorum sp. HK-1]|nr:lipoprotein [Candidatus Magnetomorum sp. HK-1]